MPRLHLIIHGRVQGVGYRYWARQVAQSLNLVGWVKNNPDGTVELVATGEKTILEIFLEQCRQGPPSGQVSRVDSDLGENEKEEFLDFEIRR